MRRISTIGLFLMMGASAYAGPTFSVGNLVTDNPSVNGAQITDANLHNAWGISYAPTGPFWVSNNGTGTATLYSVTPATNATSQVPLVVSIPGDGSVTGQVFNGNAAAFHGDNFVFASEDGTISGWRGALGTVAEILQTALPGNVYKGITEATIGGNSYLYAANFRTGAIDVLKGTPAAPSLSGLFTDPTIPTGYAPFNIANLGGKLYVTYALQDSAKKDDVAGAGHGFVDAFDLQGNFLGRVGSQGTLDSPWGLTIAPTSFGSIAGDLLVGNFGDGRINAFNPSTATFDGQLLGQDGLPLAIDGLWGLIVGNDARAGSSQSVYFSAGPNEESDGLFGVISPTPEPSTMISGGIALMISLGAVLRRRRASSTTQ